MNFAHYGTFSFKWMTEHEAFGYLIDPLMCNIFWPSRGKSTSGGEAGRYERQRKDVKTNQQQSFYRRETRRTVKEDALIYLGGAIQVKLGLLDLLASLQVADKTCSDCRNNKNHTLSQRCKRPRLKYR